MAATLNITDNTITIDLLSAKVDYQLAASGGYPQSDPDLRQIRHESFWAEGDGLIASQAKNIIDSFTISLYGASHNAVATNLQKLATLARKARESRMTFWQKTPVYMTAKTTDETNTRYSRVTDIRFKLGSSLFSSMFNANNALDNISIQIEREPYWTSHIPGTLPAAALTIGAPQAPSPQADATEQFLMNFRDTSALTHIYNYDDSLTSFSTNLIASTAFSYFPASPAVNDIVYFGSTTGPFRAVVLNIGVAGNYSVTITWEFWSGAAWVSTAGGIYESGTFTSTGRKPIYIDTPTGWATTAINGVTAFWIRARISAFTSWTTSPTQATQVVYDPRDCYISIANTQITGDVDALALIRFFKWWFTTLGVRFVAIGLKSQGLTTFTSRLNAGGQNPTGWSISYGTDTSIAGGSDIESPGGIRALCTFATDPSMTGRVTFIVSTTAIIADLEGEYNAYLRCQQIGGSAGAVSVRLETAYNAVYVDGPTVPLTAVAGGIELVNLGRVVINPARLLASGEAALNEAINIVVQASATSATPDLRIYDLILIPIDEWSFVAAIDTSLVKYIGAAANDVLEMDGGLVRQAAMIKTDSTNNRVVMFCEPRGKLPQLPPDKNLQLHFLFADKPASTWYASNYQGGSVKIWAHLRWLFMRGSE